MIRIQEILDQVAANNANADLQLIQRAYVFAAQAHAGQTRLSGEPYLSHPLAVAFTLSAMGFDEPTVAAGLLHDTVEDTSVTLEDLAEIFPAEVVNAVRLLTHDKGTDYDDYVREIRNDPVAKAVKTADLMHNSDPARLALADVTPEKRLRLSETYARAKRILAGADE